MALQTPAKLLRLVITLAFYCSLTIHDDIVRGLLMLLSASYTLAFEANKSHYTYIWQIGGHICVFVLYLWQKVEV